MSNEAIFNVNYNRLAEWLLPTFLRQKTTLKWLIALLSGLKKLHQDFLAFRKESLYKLDHTGQVVYLEAVLNDRFDNLSRRIYIQNTELREPLWFYEVADNRPIFFYELEDKSPVYFREDGEDITGGIDFTVYVPLGLRPNNEGHLDNFINQMRTLINYYKLYSKNYQIIFQ